MRSNQMIRSFADKHTEALYEEKRTRKVPVEIQSRALEKLRLIDSAVLLEDLRIPPGNRLEALKGDRLGQYSIRINRSWRICFEWEDGDAFNVEVNNHYG